jgi:amino acid adenylation domain-containing protein
VGRALRGEDETRLRHVRFPLKTSAESLNAILSSESIPSRFAQAIARFAARIAVSAPAGQWTYAELDRRSNFIAAKIISQLGEVSEPVALLMDHDAPLIAAILGALKANKIYLALDPNHPPEQLAAMLANSGAKLLLTNNKNLALANSLASKELKIFPGAESFPGDLPRANFPEIHADADAWLMFTSGSTSAPKGVWQNHRGIVHEAEIYAELIGLTPDDRVSLLASCGLSASGATLFATLITGATLGLFHVRSQGVERLADWLPRERITIFHSVPTVFRHLARAADGKNSFETLRLVRLGGEPVLRGDVEMFRRQCPDNCRFVQSLSSTETGMISTFAMDKQTVVKNPRVPSGYAVRGAEIFLVDEKNEPLKNGGEGKIAVRSARLRQGYWRQPELTEEKFLPDGRDPNFRIFISNDLGKFLPDGALEHLGRADQLVKIHGQRVDLGEVETALLATERVKEAVVIALEDESGEKRLAAYIVPRPGANVSSQNSRRELRAQLPDYMIPNDFVVLEKLPQTPGGKIDRRALPLPPTPANKNGLGRGQRPRDVVETRLARIWELVLNFSPVGRTDDFFELGGTSLQSVEVLLHIEELFGVSLPPSTLAEHSTIEKMAVLLVDHAVIPSPSPLVKLRDGAGGRPLFLIHSGQGDVASYGLLTRRLPGRPIYGLQSVGLHGESWPLMSVSAMARCYLPEIIAQDPTGPYLIAGTCMGGMVALELAQLLVQQGRQVGLLALLDSLHPRQSWGHHEWREKFYGVLRDPVRDAFRRLRWSIIHASGLGRGTRWLPSYRRFVTHMNSRANRSYKPKPYPGAITIFITADTKFVGEDLRFSMQRYAKESHVITIPGNRIKLFIKPAVDELARQLQSRLESAENKKIS